LLNSAKLMAKVCWRTTAGVWKNRFFTAFFVVCTDFLAGGAVWEMLPEFAGEQGDWLRGATAAVR
jgi:hypothetical protein